MLPKGYVACFGFVFYDVVEGRTHGITGFVDVTPDPVRSGVWRHGLGGRDAGDLQVERSEDTAVPKVSEPRDYID